MVAPAPRPRGVRVRTAHASEADFIAAFHDVCDELTIFAPTEKMKPIGADCAFSLELVDGTPMIRGLGRIRNAWPTDDSPFGRPGIHIEIGQLTDTSKPILARLIAANKVAKPRNRPAPSTHQLWGAPSGPPTEEMDTPEVEEPEVAELPQKITRELRIMVPQEILQASDEGETQEALRYNDPPPSPPRGATPPAPLRKVSPTPAAVPVPLGAAPSGPAPIALVAATSAPMAAPQPIAREGTVPNAAVPVPVPQPRPLTAPAPLVAPPGAAAVEPGFDLDAAIAATRARPWWMNARVGLVFAAGLALGLVVSLMFRPSAKPQVTAAAAPPAEPPTQVAAMQPPQNCPPVDVAADEPADEAPVASKARVGKASKPAEAAAKVAPARVATKAAPTTKATPAPTKPKAAAKVASTPVKVATKAAPVKKATPKAKPAVSARPKVATTKRVKRKKSACSSLDCI